MKSLLSAAAMGAALLLAASPAAAQNWQLAPTYGTVALSSGFTPDPYNKQLSSGGVNDAARTIGGNCVGFVATAPDFDLNWTAGSGALPLAISVTASADTTLVINGPDGRWYCNDDGGNNGFNPSVVFNNPQSGLYDIYVGTYGSGTNYPATLTISELYSQ